MFVPIASGSFTGHYSREPGSIFFVPSLEAFKYIDEDPPDQDFLVLHVSGNGFQDKLLYCFPRDQDEVDWPVFPLVLLALEGRTDTCSPPVLDTYHSCHDQSKIESGFTMTFASSLSTHGVYPIRAHELMHVRFFLSTP